MPDRPAFPVTAAVRPLRNGDAEIFDADTGAILLYLARHGAVDPLAVANSLMGNRWRPTHRHRDGGLYQLSEHGKIEAGWVDASFYRAPSGLLIARPTGEFNDGRFTALPARPAR